MNRSTDPYRESRIYGILILGGILFLMLAVFITDKHRKVQFEEKAEERIQLMKETCQKYNDYEMGITTKDLQALINKANIIRQYENSSEEETVSGLEKFAIEQYLSGIVLLDQNMDIEYEVCVTEDTEQKLINKILEDRQIRQIRDYPEKVFADRTEVEGQIYEYALAARMNQSGVLICYVNTSELKDDKYELSLNNMLDMNSQDKNQVMVVTDEKKVLATNAPSLIGLTVEECPITSVVEESKKSDNPGMIKLQKNGHIWYGKHDVYKTYYLYVFYRSDRTMSEFLGQFGIWGGVYLIFCLVFLLFLQYRRKAKLQQMEKEYYLSNAIARIYEVNLLLYPEKNTWEVILQTPDMEKVLSGIQDADVMLREFSSKLMMASAGEIFLQFTDLKTMRERLQNQSFIGYTFEAVSGRWYQVLLVPQNPDSRSGKRPVMFLMRNVTEQRKKELDYQQKLQETAEKAAIANAAKTDFLRRMSHDIRTPINGIKGMTEMGEKCLNDPGKLKSCFEKIHTATDFLLELVNNVLDMSKIEAGETITEKISFDMQEVLNRAVTIVACQARDSAINLYCDMLQGEHWNLIGSPLNIQRVFQNIMSNAVKYNHPGGFVRVSCQETAYDGEEVTFTFVCEDNGMGMSEEFQRHAYEIFAQEHKTARTTYEGSGIGLAIVKKTVDLMGGKISFQSQEGVGTTFIIEMTLKEDQSSRENTQKEEENCSIEGTKILLAEDNKLNMEIASYLLTEQGAVVTEAWNGKEAVDLFTASEADAYDIILMDIMMPVMNGLEAAKAIRTSGHPDAKTIPIIAVSANAFSDDIAASRDSGMNAHLSKPLNAEQLLKTISRYQKYKSLNKRKVF